MSDQHLKQPLPIPFAKPRIMHLWLLAASKLLRALHFNLTMRHMLNANTYRRTQQDTGTAGKLQKNV